jgi:RimJ/RimL family protein N-acetyltransferase
VVTGGADRVEFPEAPPLAGLRVDLEPLRVEHAEELAPLLDDPALHRFTGGAPASLPQWRERVREQVGGRSADGSERWLNWVVRRREDGRAVGTVQATVTRTADGRSAAELAWIVAVPHQRQGFAREAAGVLAAWLRRRGAGTLLAHVHPEHGASQAVARAVGLAPTTTVVDGEVRWQG